MKNLFTELRIALFAVVSCTMPVLARAQGSSSSGASTLIASRNGPKIGFGIATQTSGQFLAWNGLPKFGPLAGWSFEAPITYQVSLLIEPMYIAKGSVTVNSALKTRSSVALNYLELPAMLKISTNPDPQGLFITGGLIYGYFLNGKIKNYQDGELITKYDLVPSGTTNRSQWSAALGIGHEIGNWMWEIRGQSSLSTFDTFVRSHNVVFSAQVAWRFPLREDRDKRRQEKAEKKADADDSDKDDGN